MKDGKENIPGLTDAFTKFSQVLITSQQKAITIAKILVDKWFYLYGIPAHIHSNKGHTFDSEIMSHLYAIYGVEQSTTTPYNLCGNVPTEITVCNWAAQIITQGAEEQLAITSTITGICM